MGVYADAMAIGRERGWGRINMIDSKTGCVCIIGAIALATGIPEASLHDESVEVTGLYKLPECEYLVGVMRDIQVEKGWGDLARLWEVNDMLGVQAVEDLLIEGEKCLESLREN